MQNLLRFAGDVAGGGPAGGADGRPPVSVRRCARRRQRPLRRCCARRRLTAGRAYALTGPRAVGYAEVAGLIGEMIGRRVVYERGRSRAVPRRPPRRRRARVACRRPGGHRGRLHRRRERPALRPGIAARAARRRRSSGSSPTTATSSSPAPPEPPLTDGIARRASGAARDPDRRRERAGRPPGLALRDAARRAPLRARREPGRDRRGHARAEHGRDARRHRALRRPRPDARRTSPATRPSTRARSTGSPPSGSMPTWASS